MKNLAKACFFAGYASIPVSIFAYLQESQSLGIFIGLWVPTLLLSGMLAGRDQVIYTHLKTIEAEIKKAFKLVDVGKAGQAPMFARLVNIERELWSIRQIMNAEEKDDQ